MGVGAPGRRKWCVKTKGGRQCAASDGLKVVSHGLRQVLVGRGGVSEQPLVRAVWASLESLRLGQDFSLRAMRKLRKV